MLIKRGDTWYTRLMYGRVLYQRSLKTRNKAEAARLEAVFRSGLVKKEFGIIDVRDAPTLLELETKLTNNWAANTAPRTAAFYGEHLAVLKRYIPMATCRISSIDSAMIENFIQWRLKEKVSPTTCNHSLRTLRRILYLAKKWAMIRDVPAISLLPNENVREAVITDWMLDKMVKWVAKAYPKSTMQHLLVFLVDSGLRISEACNLQRTHVTYDGDLKPVSVRVVAGKSKYARRTVPLTERAALALESCIKRSRSEYCFAGKGGKGHATRHYPSEMFRTIRDAMNLGPDYVLHSCRHTFCTRLAAMGCNASMIQHLAGHSSISISQKYIHDDESAKVAAIELLNNANKRPAPVASGTVKTI